MICPADSGKVSLHMKPNGASHPALGSVYGIMRWMVAIVLLRFFWQEKRDRHTS
jgi:hypothetical protein